LRTGPTNFEPGEIAHLSGGGVHAAFYDFLLSENYSLLQGENWRGHPRLRHAKKYCVVLKRVDRDRYLVCYLTTFEGGANLSPLAKFFSIAMQDTPEWPPGIKSIKTHPPWKGRAFLFGAPVIRKGLKAPLLSHRIMLAFGELQRVQKMIEERNMAS
jgi:hypothetical protein